MAVLYGCCGLSITAGYHRLFSHQTYRAHWLIRAFFLAFGAGAFQNSALAWSEDHRRHHRYTDGTQDPYGISHGFWWAHIGWIFHAHQKDAIRMKVDDLRRDPLVRLQHKYWLLVGIAFGIGVPTAIAALWGDVLGGFLVAGWLRLVLAWHCTFAVNSFAHRFGKPNWAPDDSAKDSVWVAFLTLGEGYHSYHHRFQSDYRNGIRWYHYDPSKWLIWTLSKIGLARDLTRVPAAALQRAKDRIAAPAARPALATSSPAPPPLEEEATPS